MSATERHLIVETVLDGRWMPCVEGLVPGSHARVAEHEPSPYLRIFVQDMKIPAVAVVHLTAEDALKFAEQIRFLAEPGRERAIAARPEAAAASIDDAIDAWHAARSQNLPEFLGMSDEQHKHWVETGALPDGSPFAAGAAAVADAKEEKGVSR